MAAARDETAWFARTLVPALRQDLTSWTDAAVARVVATEDRLTVLAEGAPDDRARLEAVGLRDAVRDSRAQVVAVTETPESARERLDAVQDRLEGALRET